MKKRAVLIVHGFGGDESEIIYLYEHLKAKEIDAFWVGLTGHGKDKENFSKAKYEEWIDDVEQKLIELERDYEKITCIGFSMGGLLTIQVSNRPSIDQMVLCSTPIFLYNLRVISKDIMEGVFKRNKKLLSYYFGSAKETSAKACLEFLTLLKHTRKKLKKKIPWKTKKRILICQNRDDETTYYKSAYYLAKHCNAEVSVNIYEGGRHQLFSGVNKDIIVSDIEEFIESDSIGQEDLSYLFN